MTVFRISSSIRRLKNRFMLTCILACVFYYYKGNHSLWKKVTLYHNGTRKYLNIWNNMNNASRYLPKNLKFYKTVMNISEYNTFMDLLDGFSRAMEVNNLTYFMNGGTLLGSMRHHGPIPWDDDIDIMVNRNESNQIWQVFKKLASKYVITTVMNESYWKVYFKESYWIKPEIYWKWPFVDLWFYDDLGDKIVDISCLSSKPKAKCEYGKSVIFPLKKRPFADMKLFAPCDSVAFLNFFYKSWSLNCESRTWDHKKELGLTRPSLHDKTRCLLLRDHVPFVYRAFQDDDTVREVLFYKNKKVTTFQDDLSHC